MKAVTDGRVVVLVFETPAEMKRVGNMLVAAAPGILRIAVGPVNASDAELKAALGIARKTLPSGPIKQGPKTPKVPPVPPA